MPVLIWAFLEGAAVTLLALALKELWYDRPNFKRPSIGIAP
jgi:hypothetical protein